MGFCGCYGGWSGFSALEGGGGGTGGCQLSMTGRKAFSFCVRQ